MLKREVYKLNPDVLMEDMLMGYMRWMKNNSGDLSTTAIQHLVSGNWFSAQQAKRAYSEMLEILSYHDTVCDTYIAMEYDDLVQSKLALVKDWREALKFFKELLLQEMIVMETEVNV